MKLGSFRLSWLKLERSLDSSTSSAQKDRTQFDISHPVIIPFDQPPFWRICTKKRHRWFQTSPTPDIFDSKSFKGFDVFFDGLLTKLSACRQCIAPGEGVDVAVASEVYSSCEHHISTTLNQLYITYIIIHHLLLHYVVIYVDVHESIHSDGVFPCQIENGDHPDG